MRPALQLTAVVSMVAAAAVAVGDVIGNPALVISSCLVVGCAVAVVGYLMTSGD